MFLLDLFLELSSNLYNSYIHILSNNFPPVKDNLFDYVFVTHYAMLFYISATFDRMYSYIHDNRENFQIFFILVYVLMVFHGLYMLYSFFTKSSNIFVTCEESYLYFLIFHLLFYFFFWFFSSRSLIFFREMLYEILGMLLIILFAFVYVCAVFCSFLENMSKLELEGVALVKDGVFNWRFFLKYYLESSGLMTFGDSFLEIDYSSLYPFSDAIVEVVSSLF